jgi:hypothetical protein
LKIRPKKKSELKALEQKEYLLRRRFGAFFNPYHSKNLNQMRKRIVDQFDNLH